jgi:hypothetical protein
MSFEELKFIAGIIVRRAIRYGVVSLCSVSIVAAAPPAAEQKPP